MSECHWCLTAFILGCVISSTTQQDSAVRGTPKGLDYCRILGATCETSCSVFRTISLTALCPNNLICCRSQNGNKGNQTKNSYFWNRVDIPDVGEELENYMTYTAPTTTKRKPSFFDFFRDYRDKSKTKIKQEIEESFLNSLKKFKLTNIESIWSKLNRSSKHHNSERCGLPMNARFRRVVGGALVGRCVYPWMVYISRDPGKDDLCGGTLVSDRHILTAAHCFDFLESRWPTLTIGEYIKGEERVASKFVTSNYTAVSHPNYDSFTYSHDIALLTLAQPIDLDKFECLNPICLPQPRQFVSIGDSCSVAGWGSTSRTINAPAVSTSFLMSTSVRVVNGSYCQDKFGSLYNPRIHICAGDMSGSSDSCLGDSGGPFMCSHDVTNKGNTEDETSRLYLMGVISAGGAPCAQKDTPALYTNISQVMDWIQTEMASSDQ
ncbi:transmembrane protease serine 9 [Biomphalaria pfeifferi]|uniref:Transmembrane protease serine 9 n=1 Tax=Biomphalaria pfeifferi TaxID=112525 RepID=A0AAD8BBI6_BIOPF|nr:transmembrane protease serine 9 [Biomphalaria pfeifferi]